MLTRRIDSRSFFANPQLFADATGTPEVRGTHAAHIIPSHLVQKVADDVQDVLTRDVLRLFGGIDVDKLNGDSLHQTDNILTLSTDAHEFFDELHLWLEPLAVSSHLLSVYCLAV